MLDEIHPPNLSTSLAQYTRRGGLFTSSVLVVYSIIQLLQGLGCIHGEAFPSLNWSPALQLSSISHLHPRGHPIK